MGGFNGTGGKPGKKEKCLFPGGRNAAASFIVGYN